MYAEPVFKKNAVMIVIRDIEKYTDLILDLLASYNQIEKGKGFVA
jgi:hypothetical protein